MEYRCSNCGRFSYDEQNGKLTITLDAHTVPEDVLGTDQCPVCSALTTYMLAASDTPTPPPKTSDADNQVEKDLIYYRRRAREKLAHVCGVYPVCDGTPTRICTGQKYGAPIGFGGAGQAKTFEANYRALQRYRLKMRVIKPHHEPEMSVSLFGKDIVAPVMGAALSGVKNNMNDVMPEKEFYFGLLRGAQAFGTIGMVGNTPSGPDDVGVTSVGQHDGWGIPILKPQSQ